MEEGRGGEGRGGEGRGGEGGEERGKRRKKAAEAVRQLHFLLSSNTVLRQNYLIEKKCMWLEHFNR